MRFRLTVAALAVATSFTATVVTTPTTADATEYPDPPTSSVETLGYWNEVLLDAYRASEAGPPELARAGAIVHAGIFDTINSAWWAKKTHTATGYESYRQRYAADPNVDDDLAVGLVARKLIGDLFPGDSSHAAGAAFTARHGDTTQKAASDLASEIILTYRVDRAADGYDTDPAYEPDGVPGSWRPTDGCTPVTPLWGQLVPFSLDSGDQFRLPPPAGVTQYSQLLELDLYQDQLDEVRRLGGSNSAERTSEMTDIAHFWANDFNGTYKPPGHFLEITQTVVEDQAVDSLEASRTFALTAIALADAGIAVRDQKYRTSFDLWRPESAINEDPVEAQRDTSWEPLLQNAAGDHVSPCFPAYTSGHATFGGAWSTVMSDIYGDTLTFTIGTDDPAITDPGYTRTFTSFSQMSQEVAVSRVYLGVHFRFDGDDGISLGTDVGRWVMDHELPALTIERQPGGGA